MGSLILAAASNTIMIFSMRFAEKAKAERRTIILWNYVFGSLLAFLLGGGFQGGLSFGKEALFPMALGLVNAFLMVACMLIQQNSISANGTGLTTTYNRLGVLIPTVLSIFLFQEYPSLLKIAGILLSVAAIIYSYDKKTSENGKNFGLLIGVLSFGGLIDFNSKLLGVFSEPEMKNIYTFITFFCSAVIMTVMVLKQKAPASKKDIKYGAMIGIPNICITFGMVGAAAQLPSYLVFPVYSGAVILLVNGIGAFLPGEKLTKREAIATAMIAAALVLLNI